MIFSVMVEHSPEALLPATFAALGHPVRCAIVARLQGGEARVTDVAGAFPISLAAVSRHIAVLEGAGIIRRRVEGRTHWLSLDPARLAEARRWLADPAAFWAGRLRALAEALGSMGSPADAGAEAVDAGADAATERSA
jgi:DNA-binding transcriptional ArsR family regulator